MKNIYHDLGSLLSKLGEDELVQAIPIFSRMVSEIIEEIKKTEDIGSADSALDLLLAISSPLATLAYKYKHELPSDLVEILKIEGYLYPDQGGQYKESREPIYRSIKTGELFVATL